MLRSALAFLAGAAAMHVLPVPWPPVVAAVPALAAACALRRAPALAACLAGCACALHAAATAVSGAWPCARDRETVEVAGHIASPPVVRPDRIEFDLETASSAPHSPWTGRVRLSWYDADRLPSAGERWRIRARLRCPRGFSNPGSPDRELGLLRDGIDATGYVVDGDAAELIGESSAPDVERLRERVAGAIADALPAGPTVAVLQGLAVGVRGNISDALWEAFAATGLAHLIAISGLHVTGCALMALLALRFAWRLRVLPPTRARLAIEMTAVVAVTAAYALLSGASIPALRTLAMVALFALLRCLRRSPPLAESLALAATVLVAADPLAITSAGFWLSFVATAALFAAGSAGTGWRGWVRGFARAQLAITILLAPVLAATFGRLSLVAPLVNAAAIPVFSILILPAVLLGTVLAVFAPAASSLLWQGLGGLLDGSWPVLTAIGGWPLASFAPAAQPLALVVAATALSFGALLVPSRGIAAAAAVILGALVCGRAAVVEPGAFTLTVIDVGQGLAAVVETAGHTLVFDTGPRWRGGSVAARVSLLPYLRARGVRRIDRLVVSHDDQDHAGGFPLVSAGVNVARTMAPPGSRANAGETCASGAGWRWDGIEFRVLHPPAGFDGSDNDRSCAIRVSGPGGSVLLLADPEAAAESLLVGQPIAADVVLIPHHGSAGSSSPALIGAVSARLGIASSGFGNRWAMPRAEVVARWRVAGTTVLNTAEQGAVRVRIPSGPGPITVETERRDRPHWWRARPGR
ncbi:MAG TPA: DNA internalization-related competence protein ComEC/Rec2 [Steroidobacteraceae bacterium]|nr:DNA internalization-related competence protein ComEC/Rec2 [Steroidobacteraceae bacterium]